MARPKKLLTEDSIMQLNSITKSDSTAAVGYRLAAVRAYVNHSAKEVAHFFNVKNETIIRWVSKYQKYGIEGLENKRKGHRIMKLSEENIGIVRMWLDNDCNAKGERVHWTLNRLSLEIKDFFNIDISVSALSATFRKYKIALKRPRPMHYNSSEEKRKEFKKKSTERNR